MQLVRGQVIVEEDVMASFDVVSLFSNCLIVTAVAETRLREGVSLPSRTA